MDYTTTVTLRDWSQTFDSAEDRDPVELLADGAVAMSGLTAQWSTPGELWPAQPSPVTTTLSLWVPDVTAFAPPVSGDHVSVVILPADWAGMEIEQNLPPFETYGRVDTAEASPLRDGIRYDLVVVDYLGDLAEENLGAQPFATVGGGTEWWDRYAQIQARSRLPLGDLLFYGGGYSGILNPREAAVTTTADLIEEVFSDASIWFSYTSNIIDPAQPVRHPLAFWERPIMAYRYYGPDAVATQEPTRAVTFERDQMRSNVPTDGGLPLRLVLDGAGQASVEVRPDFDTGFFAQPIPAHALVRDSFRWVQTKEGNPNTVRLTGNFTITDNDPLGPVEPEVVRRNDAEVAARGPVELVKPSALYYSAYGYACALMYLGDPYRQRPRWSLEEVTILPEQIDTGRRWPRLFPGSLEGVYQAGGLVLLTGLPAKYNLYHRADYPARAVGARLVYDRGRLRITATLRHDVPTPSGEPEDWLTAASLAAAPAFAGLRASQLGDLAGVDLRLVHRPT